MPQDVLKIAVVSATASRRRCTELARAQSAVDDLARGAAGQVVRCFSLCFGRNDRLGAIGTLP
jgi:N-acetyl-gamma-glutamylphosphate reductase